MKEFLLKNWEAIASVIGAIVIWFRKEIANYFSIKHQQSLDDKKQKLQEKSNTIENLDKAVNVYKVLLDDIITQHTQQLLARDERISQLEKRVSELERELHEYKNGGV